MKRLMVVAKLTQCLISTMHCGRVCVNTIDIRLDVLMIYGD
jgi:hypothetical protein